MPLFNHKRSRDHILWRICTDKSSILHTTYASGALKILQSLMMTTNSMAILKGKVVSLDTANTSANVQVETLACAHSHTVHGKHISKCTS